MNIRATASIFLLLLGLLFSPAAKAQTVEAFSLPGGSGKTVSLANSSKKTGVVIIFTSNHCVYSKKYEERLIGLANEYQPKGIDFLFINSNNPENNPEETMEAMAARMKEKSYPFPYLQDADQAVATSMGATKTPEAFLLIPGEAGSFNIIYSGKIDDNPLMAEKVKSHYLKDAIDKLLGGDTSPSESTDPSGCNIRD